MNSQLDDLEVLRTLDPAADELDATSPQAQAMLRSILTSEQADVPRVRRRPSRRLRLSLAAAAASVAVVAGGVVVVPALTGSDAAFATWTGTPSVVSASERSELAARCRDALGDTGDDIPGADSAVGAIAERRGEWSLVVLTGDHGYQGLCVTNDSGPFFQAMFGGVGNGVPGSQEIGAREVFTTDLGGGSIDGESLSVAAGTVGADIVGISYESAEYGTVRASVAGGRFAFWFPGSELDSSMAAGVDAEVTYRDGTTGTTRLSLTGMPSTSKASTN